MGSNVKLACAVLMCMVVAGAPMAEAAIPCNFVTGSIIPCLPFLQHGGAVAPRCCTGIRNILLAAKNTADRQAVCNCLKSAAATAGGSINPKNAEALPGKCGVSIPYKISTSTNCASIK